MDKIAKGKKGEAWAEDYLTKNGYIFLARNYRKRQGEIDLVMKDSKTGETVFVEVKARKNRDFGYPEEAVTATKLRKLAKAAMLYLYEKKMEETPWRIDVVAIEVSSDPPKITHLKNVTQNLF